MKSISILKSTFLLHNIYIRFVYIYIHILSLGNKKIPNKFFGESIPFLMVNNDQIL